MPQNINNKKVFTLLEVTQSIERTLNGRYKDSFWVRAEMNKLNFYRPSGNCYPELVEKENGEVTAQMKATLWQDDYTAINNNFRTVLNEPLKDGIKILFQAMISFHPIYGLQLRIVDIDPSYTVGDLQREKQETINRLIAEGLFNKNKTLELSILPQRIAIISAETSKGYLDFLGKIESNKWGYKFFHILFSSQLQGEIIVQTITAQLNRIRKVKDHFDAVAIIRGGGNDVGFSAYNNYQLAKEIATFPIPILTGIGHITNETVVELVSFQNLITPTDLADYVIHKFNDYSSTVQNAEKKIIDRTHRLISDEKSKFQSELKLFRSVTENILLINKNQIKGGIQSLKLQTRFHFKQKKEHLFIMNQSIRKDTNILWNNASQEIARIAMTLNKDILVQLGALKLFLKQKTKNYIVGSKSFIKANTEKLNQKQEKLSDKGRLNLHYERIKLNNYEKNVNNMSPEVVMRRGYTITLFNGKALSDIEQVKQGETITTILLNGNINSTIKSTNKPNEL